jgi:hypothetical protein
MLVGGSYRFRSGPDQRVALKRFLAWTPPAGFTFQAHWVRVDGTGGMYVAEAESAAAVFEATGAFSDLIEFEVVPVMDVAESVPISSRVLDWVDSVG